MPGFGRAFVVFAPWCTDGCCNAGRRSPSRKTRPLFTRNPNMSKHAFGKALEAMVNDGDAAASLANGDFEALPDLDATFTPAEQAMLQAAASEIPEVSGFSNQFLKLGYIGETEKNLGYVGETEKNLTTIQSQFGPRFREAAEYYRFELSD